MARNQVRFSDSEKEKLFALHEKKVGSQEIADQLNAEFHEGEPVRSAQSVYLKVWKRKKEAASS